MTIFARSTAHLAKFALCGALGSLPVPVQANDQSDAQRRRVEDCVWESVQRQVPSGALIDDFDARLSVGRAAVAECDFWIVSWARNSPAVKESGEPAEEVAGRMR